MAEIGLIASVIGIAGFAVKVSQRLYEFSATTSAAGEEIDFVASNINNYAIALELLAERLENDSDDPIYSGRVVDLVARLYDQSCNLFDDIEDAIPTPRLGRDDLSFMQRVAWNFKKSRVEFLASQIECLKSTVNLVATVLFAGKKVRSKRRSQRNRKHPGHSRTADEQLARAQQKVGVAVMEQVQTSGRLARLQRTAAGEARTTLQDTHSDNSDLISGETRTDSIQLFDSDNSVLPAHLVSTNGTSGQKQLILNQAADIFNHLLQQFTTVLDDDDSTVLRDEAEPTPAVARSHSTGDRRDRQSGSRSRHRSRETENNVVESTKPSKQSKNRDYAPRPSIPDRQSLASNVAAHPREEKPRDAQRRHQYSNSNRPDRPDRAVPLLARAETMPIKQPVRKDRVLAQGSDLKQSESRNFRNRDASSPDVPKAFGEMPDNERSNSDSKSPYRSSVTAEGISTDHQHDEERVQWPRSYTKVIDSSTKPNSANVSTKTIRKPADDESHRRQSRPTDNPTSNGSNPRIVTVTPGTSRQARPTNLPGIRRAETMPISRSTHKDTASARRSNLKHSETQDSGYHGSSEPVVRADSPPPSRNNLQKKPASLKYRIVTPGDDDEEDRASRVQVLDSDEG